ncbi:hypothetical protein AVEN_71448-1 [Araneus ventricosus]|uniref:Uncharacterized protein n=1 Tax=Araneus ventricosus TaxID=182803 RepID=A0A4Y2CUE8_ARAVE|nr:hypothetical protein AVEN_71448-1 [Araneus ventricosus]
MTSLQVGQMFMRNTKQVLQKSIQSPKNVKDPTRHSQRQQKCLSHPSYMFSCGPVSSKKVLNEDSSGKEDKKISENSVASSESRAQNEAESTSPE